MFGFAIWQVVLGLVGIILFLVLIYDLTQKGSAVLRIFPIIGHIRYFLIEIGPELRQYLVASDREELPFDRTEREWIYHSSERKNNYFGFGTNDQLYGIGYPIIKHSMFPYGEEAFTGSKHDKKVQIPCAKVIGKAHGRKMPYRPTSMINISAMSYGSMGKNAISALNKGAKLANCFHNTGEGGCSKYHRFGADICLQLGTGYFGARDLEGRFDSQKLQQTLHEVPQIRMIEIKLSQGAKPGKGGVLPAPKVTPEIAAARGIPEGQDCISPNSHCEFGDADGLLDFVEKIAEISGRPVGIKSAVGQLSFFYELTEKMKAQGRGPDFITIDGGEGGTGAAPLTLADHVALPFRLAFTRVYQIFHEAGLTDDITFIASGKLGFPDRAVVAMALGADLINCARETMLSIGCIQAQKCHLGNCPTGVTTHSWWRQRGLHVEENASRCQAYIETFRIELNAVTHAAGYKHPGQFTPHDVEVSAGPGIFKSLYEIYGYNKKQYAPDMEPVYKEAESHGRPPLSVSATPIPPESASTSSI